jgi:hypothetical protein
VTGRRGRRRKRLQDDLKETIGYWKLEEEALTRTVENTLWKRLWISRKTDCGVNECKLNSVLVEAKIRKEEERERQMEENKGPTRRKRRKDIGRIETNLAVVVFSLKYDHISIIE